jgi:hypothetical protein
MFPIVDQEINKILLTLLWEQPIYANLEHLKLNLQLLITQIQLGLMRHHLQTNISFLFFSTNLIIPINNDAAKIETTLTTAFARPFNRLDLPVNNAQSANVPPSIYSFILNTI